MADPLIDIPDRPAFKAAEVCEIAQIPPYVLRSWEKEFPNLGVVPRAGATRIYRRADVEQILRIKQLVFSEGLTLAGARRRLEGDPPPEPEPDFPLPEDVKVRVGKVKQELKSLLQLLGSGLATRHFARPDPAPASPNARAEPEEPETAAGDTPPPARTSSPAPGGTAPPAPGSWPPPGRAAVSGHTEPAKAARPPTPEEPALPLLDAEAETTAPPPAAAVPAETGRKRKRT